MAVTAYTLARFVADLREVAGPAADPAQILVRVPPLARELALAKRWLEPHHFTGDAEQGFGVHLLHEEPDHTLAVFALAWLPGRGARPHNHRTWSVVVGVEGEERNTFWKRTDDGARPGRATLVKQSERVFGPGEVVTLGPEGIHSVVNETDRITVSLHVYGMHLNYTGRSQFDPERGLEEAYIVKVV